MKRDLCQAKNEALKALKKESSEVTALVAIYNALCDKANEISIYAPQEIEYELI